MSKLETAAQFISLMEEGKYENKINAQRAAGRTRLIDSEKKKAFAAIESHFGASDTPPKKPGKKAAKKAKKKAAKKVAVQQAAPAPEAPAPAAKKTGKKKAAAKKKVTASAKPPAGSLAISPSQVETVADVLVVIDSTVSRSVSIMNALQQADMINNKAGDISAGVATVKQALIGAAQLLQNSVVAPLRHAGTQADAEIAQRLEQVVNASNAPFQGDHAIPPQPPPLSAPPS